MFNTKNKINEKNKAKEEYLIENKINSFISKNKGNCFIFFFNKEEMLKEYSKNVIKDMIKNTIEISNEINENEIVEVEKTNLLYFNINDYEFGSEIIEETFNISEFPFLIKLKNFNISSVFKDFLYIEKY